MDTRLPHFVARRLLVPHSAGGVRRWTAGAAGLGAFLTAVVGLYPQFDNGQLRLLVAVGAAAFGALMMWIATRARKRWAAVMTTIGLGAAFGFLNTILPAIALTMDRSDRFPTAVFFGVIFGVPTGILYAIPLSILSALVVRPIHGRSVDAADRGRARASFWCGLVALFALVGGLQIDAPMITVTFAGIIAVSGIVAGSLFTAMNSRRSSWTKRVRYGHEPMFVIRPRRPEDPPELPRLQDGTSVVEWTPKAAITDGIYRAPAAGIPLAIVAD